MLLAVGGHLLGEDVAASCVRWAGGLAGGVGSSHQELCGALSGGVLVIGGLWGRDLPEGELHLCREATVLFRSRFLNEFGSTQCAALREHMFADGGLGSCERLTERAARILMEVLSELQAQSQEGEKD
jgi:C_GCAxxG_C_C family probable redox protein